MPASVGWVWLVVLIPFLGFVVNGALAVRRSRAKGIVTTVGVGVLVAAFAAALVIAVAVLRHPPGETPYVVDLWSWVPVGALTIDVALQVDQAEDRHERADMERGSGRIEAVVAADRLSRGETRLQAAAVLVEHSPPPQLVEQAGQPRILPIASFGFASQGHRRYRSLP